jgi:Flp pilus assembly protein TadG
VTRTHRATTPAERRQGDHGQATVEFALALGLLTVVIAGVIHVAGGIARQVDLDLLARDAARQASRSADPGDGARHVVDRHRAADDITTEVRVDDGLVTVTLGRGPHRSSVTMALEPP